MMNAYKKVGVDINKAATLIKSLNVEGFGALLDLGDRKLVLSTDGVGTKLLLAEELGIYDTIGIDLVAMCVNDILCHGAKPVAFLDYYATGQLDLEKSKQILDGILKGCDLAGCKLVGGETAEMPDVYPPDGFDLAGFAVGIIEYENTIVDDVEKDDLLIGVPSSGFHSNGFSLIRNVLEHFEEKHLTPTRIYVNDILPNLKYIKSMAHITGGGIHGNLPRALPNGLTYKIDISYSEEFIELFDLCNISNYEFESTFNCGWGMILVCEDDTILSHIKDAKILGEVV